MNEKDVIRESLKRFLQSLTDEQVEILRHEIIAEIVDRKISKRIDENINQVINIANRRGA